MLDFLCGDKFSSLTHSFGWPAVRVWTPLATRQSVRVSPHSDLTALRQAEMVAHSAALQSPSVHPRVVDPYAWELARCTLWNSPPLAEGYDREDTRRYEVLHLSIP